MHRKFGERAAFLSARFWGVNHEDFELTLMNKRFHVLFSLWFATSTIFFNQDQRLKNDMKSAHIQKQLLRAYVDAKWVNK